MHCEEALGTYRGTGADSMDGWMPAAPAQVSCAAPFILAALHALSGWSGLCVSVALH